MRRDQTLRNAMVWVPGGRIFTKAAAAMCREIFCSRRLPFPWLCSGNVIPCSFMMQGGFPLWIAIAYGKVQLLPKPMGPSCWQQRGPVLTRGCFLFLLCQVYGVSHRDCWKLPFSCGQKALAADLLPSEGQVISGPVNSCL